MPNDETKGGQTVTKIKGKKKCGNGGGSGQPHGTNNQETTK